MIAEVHRKITLVSQRMRHMTTPARQSQFGCIYEIITIKHSIPYFYKHSSLKTNNLFKNNILLFGCTAFVLCRTRATIWYDTTNIYNIIVLKL